MPSARKIVAARARAGVESTDMAASASSSSTGGNVKIIERGGTDVEADAQGAASTSPEILAEMSKWHFIEDHEDEAVKRLGTLASPLIHYILSVSSNFATFSTLYGMPYNRDNSHGEKKHHGESHPHASAGGHSDPTWP